MKILTNFILIFLILSLFACTNEKPSDWLPTFPGINVDENTIFIKDWNPSHYILYAVDTKEDRIIYKYDGLEGTMYFTYNYYFDKDSLYVVFDFAGPNTGIPYRFNLREGRFERLRGEERKVHSIMIFDNRVWLKTYLEGVSGYPFTITTYNSKWEIERITLPEGSLSNDVFFLNGEYYLILFCFDTFDSKIYKLSNKKKILDSSLNGISYHTYQFQLNRYLVARELKEGNDGSLSHRDDYYYVNSFEPLDVQFLFSIDGDKEYIGSNSEDAIYKDGIQTTIYEKDNFLFIIARDAAEAWSSNHFFLCKRDKLDGYKEVLRKEISNVRGYTNYVWCKGHLWVKGEEGDEIYKININDLTCKVIR